MMNGTRAVKRKKRNKRKANTKSDTFSIARQSSAHINVKLDTSDTCVRRETSVSTLTPCLCVSTARLVSRFEHYYELAERLDYKFDYLLDLISSMTTRFVVFANSRTSVRKLCKQLARNGVNAAHILSRNNSDNVGNKLNDFLNGSPQVLAMTDECVARITGEQLSVASQLLNNYIIVNYNLPVKSDNYTIRYLLFGGEVPVVSIITAEDDLLINNIEDQCNVMLIEFPLKIQDIDD